MLFFYSLISVPLIEIFLFIKVGEIIIGSLQTILVVVLTAIIGYLQLKGKELKTLNMNIQE